MINHHQICRGFGIRLIISSEFNSPIVQSARNFIFLLSNMGIAVRALRFACTKSTLFLVPTRFPGRFHHSQLRHGSSLICQATRILRTDIEAKYFNCLTISHTSRNYHNSCRTFSEDPRSFKPENYPEAEWHRVNDEFERHLAQRSWFFRPLFRIMGHPKYHASSVIFQFLLVGGLVGGWIYIWFFMGYAPKPMPTDGTGRPLTEEEVGEMETIENYLHSHPVVQALRSQKYLIESRPHWSIPDKDIPHNLTGGTLRGLGRVSVAPIAFSDGEGTEFYAVVHIGKDVCGNREYVHDGLIATILDESLARCCFPALPNRIGVTANLNIDYRKQIPADSYLLVKVLSSYIIVLS